MLKASKKWGVLFAVLVGVAACSHLAPIEQVHEPLPSGTHQLSSKEVAAIISTAAPIGRGWTISQVSPTKLHAKILRHNSYAAEVDIPYSKDSYSIILTSSENMDQAKGQIAPAYNRWVEYLRDDIDRALSQAVLN